MNDNSKFWYYLKSPHFNRSTASYLFSGRSKMSELLKSACYCSLHTSKLSIMTRQFDPHILRICPGGVLCAHSAEYNILK